MKKLLKLSVPFLMLAALSGCEWSSGGGSSWNAAYNWVNFSGVYRGAGGGVLVTDYTATPGTAGTTNTVTSARIGNTDGTSTVFSGVLGNRSIQAGSLTINSAQFNLSDNGDGTLSGSGASGSIDYGTGAWNIQVSPAPDAGDSIRATYQYTIAGTQGSGSAGPGTSGIRIYAFTVFHEGETLRLTDNYGREYSGGFGSIRSTGGSEATPTEEPTPVAGEEVIAQFTASGVSPAGYNIRMVGTFQGTYNAGALQSRSLNGTWIEDGGKTGDINGSASPIAVTQ
jgi:hypothetical protein